jgi:hypothetical protein
VSRATRGAVASGAPLARVTCKRPDLAIVSQAVADSLENIRLFTGWIVRLVAPKDIVTQLITAAVPAIDPAALSFPAEETVEVFCDNPLEFRTVATEIMRRTCWTIKALPARARGGIGSLGRFARAASPYRRCSLCRATAPQANGSNSVVVPCSACGGRRYIYSRRWAAPPRPLTD